MPYDFTVCCTLPATPEAVYDAWMSGKGHSAMTGGAAKIVNRVGARYSAWDGYISGRTVALEPGRRIVQSWRTTEFGPHDPDATITVDLAPANGDCRLTLACRGVPDGQTSYETSGWREFYFEPMQAYFAAARSAPPRRMHTKR